jgi:hypothetical protein
MIVLVVVVLSLLGGTTWLALDRGVARHPARHHRLTGWGLAMCFGACVAALGVAFVHAV